MIVALATDIARKYDRLLKGNNTCAHVELKINDCSFLGDNLVIRNKARGPA